LVDLQVDPGEMINQADNPAYGKVKAELSQVLSQSLDKRGVKLSNRRKQAADE
jgi:hypothetical protein